MKHIIVLISFLLFIGFKGLAQKKICICFNEKTKHIKMEISKDSTRASFSIVKPGFETQKEALSWIGLNSADIVAWQLKSPQEQQAIKDHITNAKNTFPNGCN